MPTTLIGIQDWYINNLRKNGRRGWRLYRTKAFRSLVAIGFTGHQATEAMRDAFDMWELEDECLRSAT